eukprot:6180933-Pleurochrysis_carterae.AAC.1
MSRQELRRYSPACLRPEGTKTRTLSQQNADAIADAGFDADDGNGSAVNADALMLKLLLLRSVQLIGTSNAA